MTRVFRSDDIIGEYFGYLKVIGNGGFSDKKNGSKQQMAKVKCICGKEKKVIYYFLRKGKIKSCGCRRVEFTMRGVVRHGMSASLIYKVRSALKKRCENENDKQYKNYGGRGIKCLRKSFDEFYNDMGEGYIEGLTIDRIDNNGDYCKSNCRRTTQSEQSLNKRTNHNISLNGDVKTVTEWASESPVKYNTIIYRLKRGYSTHDAIYTVQNGKYEKTKN